MLPKPLSMVAPNAGSRGAARPTITAIKASPRGPLFRMEQESSSPRLNTPTSGRMRMRGAPAPAWLRDCKPTGTRVHQAVLTVEPKRAGAQPGQEGIGDHGGSSLGSPTEVVVKTGPLKSRAERQRRKPPPLQPDGSSIPSMRGGGWTPRWQSLQVTVSPHNALAFHDAVPAVIKGEPRPSGLELTADPRTEPRLEGQVLATTVRGAHDLSSNERVYYKFSPRRTRFAETSMSIAAGPPR